MRKPEQKLWDTMRRRAPSSTWMQRVENGAADGMADVLVVWQRATAWCELKAPELPARAGSKLFTGSCALREAQENWHLKMNSLEQSTFILARTTDNSLIALLPGSAAGRVNDMTVSEVSQHTLAATWAEVWSAMGVTG